MKKEDGTFRYRCLLQGSVLGFPHQAVAILLIFVTREEHSHRKIWVVVHDESNDKDKCMLRSFEDFQKKYECWYCCMGKDIVHLPAMMKGAHEMLKDIGLVYDASVPINKLHRLLGGSSVDGARYSEQQNLEADYNWIPVRGCVNYEESTSHTSDNVESSGGSGKKRRVSSRKVESRIVDLDKVVIDLDKTSKNTKDTSVTVVVDEPEKMLLQLKKAKVDAKAIVKNAEKAAAVVRAEVAKEVKATMTASKRAVAEAEVDLKRMRRETEQGNKRLALPSNAAPPVAPATAVIPPPILVRSQVVETIHPPIACIPPAVPTVSKLQMQLQEQLQAATLRRQIADEEVKSAAAESKIRMAQHIAAVEKDEADRLDRHKKLEATCRLRQLEVTSMLEVAETKLELQKKNRYLRKQEMLAEDRDDMDNVRENETRALSHQMKLDAMKRASL